MFISLIVDNTTSILNIISYEDIDMSDIKAHERSVPKINPKDISRRHQSVTNFSMTPKLSKF